MGHIDRKLEDAKLWVWCYGCSQPELCIPCSRCRRSDVFQHSGRYSVMIADCLLGTRLVYVLGFSYALCWSPSVISLPYSPIHTRRIGEYPKGHFDWSILFYQSHLGDSIAASSHPARSLVRFNQLKGCWMVDQYIYIYVWDESYVSAENVVSQGESSECM